MLCFSAAQDAGAIVSALCTLRPVTQRKSLGRAEAAGRGEEALPCYSHCPYPKYQYFTDCCGLREWRGFFLFSHSLLSLLVRLQAEVPLPATFFPRLLPRFSHFFKNTVFFQVLYSYSVSAIKVPSQPFSFTLWLWPFVRLRIFRVNWSPRSPRMLFSFIHSALWMEQPGVGSSSAALHSVSTQSFFFQGPFKIRLEVCWGAWRAVTHAASYVSLPATTESDGQRRGKSGRYLQRMISQGLAFFASVARSGDHSGLCPPSHPHPGKDSEPWDGGRARPLWEQLCNGHSLSSGVWRAVGAALSAICVSPADVTSDSWPLFAGGRRPLLCIFIAKCLGTASWDW